jgi:hypothetical protein
MLMAVLSLDIFLNVLLEMKFFDSNLFDILFIGLYEIVVEFLDLRVKQTN